MRLTSDFLPRRFCVAFGGNPCGIDREGCVSGSAVDGGKVTWEGKGVGSGSRARSRWAGELSLKATQP